MPWAIRSWRGNIIATRACKRDLEKAVIRLRLEPWEYEIIEVEETALRTTRKKRRGNDPFPVPPDLNPKR
jgi:hypothetical protein